MFFFCSCKYLTWNTAYYCFSFHKNCKIAYLRFNPIREWAFSGLLTDGQNLSHISCNDETWHSCTLPKENSKNIRITWHNPWVLLSSAFFHRKPANFLYLEIQIYIAFWYIISNSFNYSWGLIPTFLEVTGKKLVGVFCPPPFWIGLNTSLKSIQKFTFFLNTNNSNFSLLGA